MSAFVRNCHIPTVSRKRINLLARFIVDDFEHFADRFPARFPQGIAPVVEKDS
jgi:hypothetical protein